jgi:hypothetical protein
MRDLHDRVGQVVVCSVVLGAWNSNRDEAYGGRAAQGKVALLPSSPLSHVIEGCRDLRWVASRTYFGAQVHGAEHLDGEIRVDLADNLRGVACEQMRLLYCVV